MTTMALVASDLEGTLTTGETWRGVGRYLREAGGWRMALRYRAFFAAHAPAVLLARRGVIDEQALRLRWMRDLAGLLRGYSADDLAHIAEWVVEREFWPARQPSLWRTGRRGGGWSSSRVPTSRCWTPSRGGSTPRRSARR